MNRKLKIPLWHDATRFAPPLKGQIVAVEFEDGSYGLASTHVEMKGDGWRSLLGNRETKVKKWRQVNMEDVETLETAMSEVLKEVSDTQ